MKNNIGLTLQRLTVAEYYQLLTSTLDLIAKEELTLEDDTRVSASIERIQKMLPQLADTIRAQRNYAITAEIQSLKKTRQADLQALYDSIKPYKVSRQDTKKDAYKHLHQLFKSYRDAKSANLEQSLPLVESLLKKLRESSYITDTATLNINEQIINLIDSQKKLYDLYISRAKDMTDKKPVDTKNIRQSLHYEYSNLYQYLVVQSNFEPNSTYHKYLVTFNKIRSEYAEMLKRRYRKQAASKKAGKTDKISDTDK